MVLSAHFFLPSWAKIIQPKISYGNILLISVVSIFYYYHKSNHYDLSIKNDFKNISSIVIVIIIATALIYRIRFANTLPATEKDLFAYYVGESLFAQGEPTLPSGRRYLRGILQSIFVGFSISVFSDNLLFARLPTVIFGTLQVGIVYYIAKRFFESPVAGIIAALFTAYSPLLQVWSATARMYSLAGLLHICSLLLTLLIIEMHTQERHEGYIFYTMLIQCGLLFVFSIIVHRFVAITAILALLISIYILIEASGKKLLNSTNIATAVILLFFIFSLICDDKTDAFFNSPHPHK